MDLFDYWSKSGIAIHTIENNIDLQDWSMNGKPNQFFNLIDVINLSNSQDDVDHVYKMLTGNFEKMNFVSCMSYIVFSFRLQKNDILERSMKNTCVYIGTLTFFALLQKFSGELGVTFSSRCLLKSL